MAPIVVVSERLGALGPEEQRLESAGADLRSLPLWSLDEIRANGADAEIIVLGAVEPFGADALDALPRLRAIVRRGVGTDNVDLAAATRLGIAVANVPDASVDEVSDHALALLIATERAVPFLDRAVRDGLWTRDPSFIAAVRAPIRRLGRLTVGIVGLGRIGQAFARKAIPIYARVLGADPMIDAATAAAIGVELVERDDLLAGSDHVTLHAPLLPSTRHLINAETLGRMRRDAILVNTARGPLVDEAALLYAVRAGTLGGAGLDVTEEEPLPADSPLLEEPRIVLTAHSAASSTTTATELARRSIDAAIALLERRAPESLVNPDVLDAAALRTPELRR